MTDNVKVCPCEEARAPSHPRIGFAWDMRPWRATLACSPVVLRSGISLTRATSRAGGPGWEAVSREL